MHLWLFVGVRFREWGSEECGEAGVCGKQTPTGAPRAHDPQTRGGAAALSVCSYTCSFQSVGLVQVVPLHSLLKYLAVKAVIDRENYVTAQDYL